jgi:hypothetical protein
MVDACHQICPSARFARRATSSTASASASIVSTTSAPAAAAAGRRARRRRRRAARGLVAAAVPGADVVAGAGEVAGHRAPMTPVPSAAIVAMPAR